MIDLRPERPAASLALSLTFATFFIGLAACSALAKGAEPPIDPPPYTNVVVIVADDLGYADVGFHGSAEIRTPNLDAIAAAGVILSQAYVTSSVCSPSRAGLMTGRYPQRFGHENNLPSTRPDAGLPLTEVTMGQHFQRAGYVTGAIGKWHLGELPEQHPNRRGFDAFFGFLGGTSRYQPPIPLNRNRTPVSETRFETRAYGEEAAAFIARHAGRPFFLYVAFNAPHSPLAPDADCLAQYAAITNTARRAYAGLVCGLDAAIGTIDQALKDHGVFDDTILFFLSDNGGALQLGGRNTPLRSAKASPYEGGIRVPFVIRWPAGLAPQPAYGGKVMAFDILPTAAAAAGIGLDPPQPLDGVNLVPYLRGKAAGHPHDRLFWRRNSGTLGETSAARVGDLKLVDVRNTRGTRARFDIERDIGERQVLPAAPETDDLQNAFFEWEAEMVPPLW
jgi:arylsulfatase A-like enzyme